MSSRPKPTAFVQTDTRGNDDGEYTVTSFVPRDEEQYRSCLDITPPRLPYSLTDLDDTHPQVETGLCDDPGDIVDSLIVLGCPLEIVGVGLEAETIDWIKADLNCCKIEYKWHEDMDTIEAKRLVNECTKTQIYLIKIKACMKIQSLIA